MEGSQRDFSFHDLEGCSLPQHFQGEIAAETSDEPVSRSDSNRALFEARMSSMSDGELRVPWETGIMKQLLDRDDEIIFQIIVPAVPPDHLMPFATSGAESSEPLGMSGRPTAGSMVHAEVSMPLYSFAIRVVPDRDMFLDEAALWEKAINKWAQVFDILGFPGMLDHAVLSEQVDASIGAQSVVLHGALGVKSPRTAVERAQTLLLNFSWLRSSGRDWDPWIRLMCIQYMGQTGNQVQAAYKDITLLEALIFSKHWMDRPIPEVLLSDPQLRCRAQKLMIAKDIYHPARPLKASELALLEKAMEAVLDTRDVYLVRAVIYAAWSISRWSDARYVDQFWVEHAGCNGELFGLVGAKAIFHKTATSLAEKQRYMPLVALLQGSTGMDWSKFRIESMLELIVDINYVPFGEICRAPSQGGELCTRLRTSEEIGALINRLLKNGSVNSIASNSFKHTTLVWGGAYGLDEPSHALLGYHELQGSGSMAVYSRDMLARPLQLYCSMLSNIREARARPDESHMSRLMDLMKISENVAGTVDRTTAASAQAAFDHGQTADDDDAYDLPTPMEMECKSKMGDEQVEDDSSELPLSDSSQVSRTVIAMRLDHQQRLIPLVLAGGTGEVMWCTVLGDRAADCTWQAHGSREL